MGKETHFSLHSDLGIKITPSRVITYLSWALALHLSCGDIKVLAFLLLMKGS